MAKLLGFMGRHLCALEIALASFAFTIGCHPDAAEEPNEGMIEELLEEYPHIEIVKVGDRITRVYGQAMPLGDTPEETAEVFKSTYAPIFGVPSKDLKRADVQADRIFSSKVMLDEGDGKYKFTLFKYVQQIDGIPVFRSDLRLLVHNGAQSPLAMVASSLRPLGDFVPGTVAMQLRTDLAEIAASEADRTDARGDKVPRYSISLTHFTEPEPVIWAGVEDAEVAPVTALTFIGDNFDDSDAIQPERWLFVAEAESGKIVYTESLIVGIDVSGSVNGYATDGYDAMGCLGDALVPFSYAEVSIEEGNSSFAGLDGDFIITHDGSSSVVVNSSIGGQWFDVYHHTGDDEFMSITVTPPGPADFEYPINPDQEIKAQRNGYLFSNEVRGWTLAINPEYPIISSQTDFPVYVNRVDGYCPGNAWYDGTSINFCAAGGPYDNFAMGSIEHHEYAHHVIASGQGGYGEYGEGMADSIAMLITDDPRLGLGFYFEQCSVPLRTADNDCQYDSDQCSTCGKKVHACGKLLSGAIWSVRDELIATEPTDYLEILSDLTVNSILLHSGRRIDSQIVIDFLSLDDTGDGDLSNGSPHWLEICRGFEDHSLDCPLGLSVDPPTALESTGPPGGPFHPAGMTFTIKNTEPRTVEYSVTSNVPWITITEGTGTLAPHSETTVSVSINSSAETLDAGTYSGAIEFANLTDGFGDTTRAVTLWVDGPIYMWSMNADPGWTAEGDWSWGKPQGGGGQHGSPDPGRGFTGDNVYGYNLTGDYPHNLSETHLTTKAIDCSNLTGVTLKFYRWLGVEQPAYDHASVSVSNNGINWVTIWQNTQVVADSSWVLQEYDLSAVADGRPTVFVRWTMGSTDTAWAYCGWNIDDVQILAEVEACAEDDECDDGLYCNGPERCQGGRCVDGTPIECADAVACTDDVCHEALDSCIYVANHLYCDNGVFCDGQEICDVNAGCRDGDVPCTSEDCDEEYDYCTTVSTPRLEAKTVTAGGAQTRVDLTNTYASPVIVCSVHYENNTTPVVTRLANLTPTGFDLYLQNPSGGSVASEQVSCLIAEEGVWNIDGIQLEARRFQSTVTDENNRWQGERQSFGQSYSNPVILGQVMSSNDSDWSVFWCRGSYRTSPPTASSFYIGKTVCEDPDITREDETLGYIVFEAGHGTIGGVPFEAFVGSDTVRGFSNSPPFSYVFDSSFSSVPQVAVVTMAGMDGSNGGWAALYGAEPFTTTSMDLFIDEDQIYDPERSHPTEQVAYAVFQEPFVYPSVSECVQQQDCDDGLYCNGQEICLDGFCQPGTPLNCDDGVSCTEDICSEITFECESFPSNGLCDDGLFCNGQETCDASLDCQAGIPVVCDDGLDCTVDACNESMDACEGTPNHEFCSDGLFCNGPEICDVAGGCEAGEVPCPAGECDEMADRCEGGDCLAEGESCDTNDECCSGVCTGWWIFRHCS